MKPVEVVRFETPRGTLSLRVGSQRAPTHAWARTGERPRLTWTLAGRVATYERAAAALLERERERTNSKGLENE